MLESLRQLVGQHRGGFDRPADDDARQVAAIHDIRQFIDDAMHMRFDMLRVIALHLCLRHDVIRARRRVLVRHVRQNFSVLLHAGCINGQYAGALFVRQDDDEPVLVFDQFEQRAHPELLRPAPIGRHSDLKIALPPEVLLRVAEDDQPFAFRRVILQERQRPFAFGVEPLTVVELLVFGHAVKEIFDLCYEAAIQISCVRLVNVDIQTENAGIGARRVLLQLAYVVVRDHAHSPYYSLDAQRTSGASV